MNNMEALAKLEATVLAPLVKPGLAYRAVMSLLLLVVAAGLYFFGRQVQQGLGITGMGDQVSWGLYIATFVFFVGTSLAGTLLSAILRITGQTWQKPITRLAEVITGAALIGAAAMIVVDMGRPERLLNVYIYARLQSPLMWDVIAINSYLVGSLIYLYLPLIPDIALCRDRLGRTISPLRHKIYSILALGWQNTAHQKERLEKLINIMTLLIIPVAISVHSVTAWIFAMTFRPGWSTTILAPYFVISAFVGGIAMVIIVMSIYRKVFRVEQYITQEHYTKLAWLFLGMLTIYIYFSFAELLPGAFKFDSHEQELLPLLMNGEQAGLFWFTVIAGMMLPVLLIIWPKTRTAAGLTVTAVLVTVTMWIKKSLLLVVPTLQVPLMPFYGEGHYQPTLAEWSITIAGVAGFLFLVALFFRFFPVLPVWEVAEDLEKAGEAPQARTITALHPGQAKGGV